MCDPISLALGAVAGTTIYQTQQARKSANAAAAAQTAAQDDPAAERAKAEAEAAQRANAQLADANRRRRDQQSLLAKGAPTFTLGDSGTDPGASPLTSTGTSRSTVARVATSVLSRGAPTPTGGGSSFGGGGRGGTYTMAQL